MRVKIFAVCLAFLTIAFSSFADVIVLKSGKTIDAKIIEKTNDKIKIDVEGIGITYFLSDIVSINGETIGQETPQPQTTENSSESLTTPEATPIENLSGTSALSEATTPTKTPAPETARPEPPQTTSEENTTAPADKNTSAAITEQPQSSSPGGYNAPNLEKAGPASTDEFASSTHQESSTPSAARSRSAYPSSRFPLSGKSSEAAIAAVIASFMGIFLVIALAAYVFASLCLQMIAKKTNNEPAWLAWIPIASLFLMCKIAGLSYLWLLLLFACFIPILGAFVGIGFTIFIWYKIAIARGKPGWIGILIILPIVNFVVMGYLAFTE